MDLVTKYQADLKEKIDFYENQILSGSSFDDSEGIALEYVQRVERLKALKEALELFEHTLKVFSR
jgi:hypothetical protein